LRKEYGDQNYWNSALKYDKETGVFRWRIKPRVGMIAGSVDWRGYRVIGYKGHVISAHRLAWMLIH
jgi:hypothetical protein